MHLGIAEAAVHRIEAETLFTPEWFGWSDSTVSSITSSLSSLVVSDGPVKDVYALTILGRLSKDPAFRPSVLGIPSQEGSSLERVVEQGGAKLVSYITEWTKTASLDPEVLKRKFEEVAWMNTVVYAVGGWAGRDQSGDEYKRFSADFFA